jgi:hypothetical protein
MKMKKMMSEHESNAVVMNKIGSYDLLFEQKLIQKRQVCTGFSVYVLTLIWVHDLVTAVPGLECYNPGCAIPASATGRASYTTRIGMPYFNQRI